MSQKVDPFENRELHVFGVLVRNQIAGLSRRKEENMAKVKPIKASLGFKQVSANDVLARGNAALAGIYADKDDYPNPPIAQGTLKSQLDTLSAVISASLDGGKKAIAEREHQKEVVIKSLRQLGHYVEANCKDDMNIFLKSGFQPVISTRPPLTPASDWFRKIVAGNNSGQMKVSLMAHLGALAYLLRIRP
jgi:hypothetical protein